MKISELMLRIFPFADNSRLLSKPFPSLESAEHRLRDQTSLTEADFEKLLPWLGFLSAGGMRRLEAEFAIANIRAIQHFDKISVRIGVWTLLVNVVLFVLTLAALIIALKSYDEAKKSAEQQQHSLDSSNRNLQETVKVLTSLNMIMEEQRQKQLEVEGKVPDIRVGLRLSLTVGSQELNLSQQKITKISSAENPVRIFLMLRNLGTGPFVRPTYVVTASPKEVKIQCGAGNRSEAQNIAPNMCQFSSHQDIEPISQDEIPTEFDFSITSPTENSFTDLDIVVLGKGRPKQEYRTIVEFGHPSIR